MLHRILGGFIVATMFWQLWPPYIIQAQTAPTLVIGEIAWAGSPLSNADEWIELWNISNDPLSLAGYQLDGAGPDEGILFDETAVIEPKRAFLIANYAEDHANAAHSVTPNMVTTALSLSNAALHISLVAPDGSLVDEAGDGNTPLAGSSSPKASMLRLMPIADGALAESWTSTTDTQNFYTDIEVFGTPNICDGCGYTPPKEVLPIETTPDVSTSTVSVPLPASDPEVTVNEEVPTSTITNETVIAQASVSSPTPQFPDAVLKITGSFIAGEEISFDASSSSDPNGDIVYFTWNFGDGTSATGSHATHAYVSDGNYPFELIVSDTTFRTFATTTLAINPAPLPPPNISLNEIHPAPIEGPEWVELYGVTKDNITRLMDWRLEDGNGTIFRFTSSTIQDMALHEPFAMIELSSSRLNNGGDSVLLLRPDDSLADGVIYDKTVKGMSWSRFPDGQGEWRDASPSKLDTNTVIEKHPAALPADIQITKTANTVDPSSVRGDAAILNTSSKTPAMITTTLTTPSDAPISEASTNVSPGSVAIQKMSVAKASVKSTTVKHTTKSSSKTTLPLQTSIEQIMTIPPNTLIELSGVVGSTPGLLAKHQFVLLAPNGRGLYVRASNKQPSPPFGTKVHITGTLMNNDNGFYIRMGTHDRWSEAPGNTTVKVRQTDLTNLDIEDDWSVVQITGHVIESSKTKALIDTGGGLVEVNFSKLTNYRAERLNVQDEMRITGLLDMSGSDLKLYPRDASEIEILSHATLAPAEEETTPGFPGWLPFGAAGLTIAVTEGAKRLRKWQYEMKVQKLIAKAKE